MNQALPSSHGGLLKLYLQSFKKRNLNIFFQETMVEMMRTEQRIRAEKISLSSDKKNLEKLKQSGFCQNCSTLRRATSVSNLRYDKDIIQSDGD